MLETKNFFHKFTLRKNFDIMIAHKGEILRLTIRILQGVCFFGMLSAILFKAVLMISIPVGILSIISFEILLRIYSK